MSLLGSLVGLANNLTQSFGLQATVTYYKFLSQDGAGRRTYDAGTVKGCIYTRKIKQVRTFSGEISVSNAQIAFLDPTVVNEFDKIVLPDGTTQPIIGTDAFVDVSNAPILTEIYLG